MRDTCRQRKKREEERLRFVLVHSLFLSKPLHLPFREGDSLFLHGSSTCRRNSMSPWDSDETRSSLSVARRRKGDSLSLSLFLCDSWRKRSQTSLSRWLTSTKEIVDYLPLRGASRRRRTALSFWVDKLESEGKFKVFVVFFKHACFILHLFLF